jgi:hypothetical protein
LADSGRSVATCKNILAGIHKFGFPSAGEQPEGLNIDGVISCNEMEDNTGKTWIEIMPDLFCRSSWKNGKPHGKGCLISGTHEDCGIGQGWVDMGVLVGICGNIRPNGDKTITPFTQGFKNGIETY